MDYPSENVLREFYNFMTGNKIGSGMSRTVFENPFDKRTVIKMEDSSINFQNVKEWLLWNDFKTDKIVGKWLAPCFHISENGTFLIMAKTRPALKREIPKKLPDFLTDHKHANYGIFENRFVCHDYGTANISLAIQKRKWNPSD